MFHPQVVYAAADPATGAAACLYGDAALVEDLAARRAAWTPELAPFFPDGPAGSEFLLISFAPRRVEVWSAAHGVHPDPFGFSSAVALRSGASWADAPATHASPPGGW